MARPCDPLGASSAVAARHHRAGRLQRAGKTTTLRAAGRPTVPRRGTHRVWGPAPEADRRAAGARGRRRFDLDRARGRPDLSAMIKKQDSENPGWAPPHARPRARATMDEPFTLFPILREGLDAAAGTLERRRAADARHRPRAHVAAEAAHARRKPSLGLAPTVVLRLYDAGIRELPSLGSRSCSSQQNVQHAIELAERHFTPVLEAAGSRSPAAASSRTTSRSAAPTSGCRQPRATAAAARTGCA
jgi:branched-chain amino acid transport system ATP-binding protein